MIPGIPAAEAAIMVKAIDRVRPRLDSYSYADGKFLHEVLDRIVIKLSAPSPQQRYDLAMDAEVQRILNSEPCLSERRRAEADMALFNRGMLDLDHQMHDYWLLKGFDKLGVAEPPRGCEDCAGSWNEYLSQTQPNAVSPALDALNLQRNLLDSMHQRYLHRIQRRRPVMSISMRGSGYEETPEL